MSKRYVQHISGQGQKWEVSHDGPDDYQVQGGRAVHYLPKSEYRLCDPPEVWKDVTAECDVQGGEYLCVINHAGRGVFTGRGYRFRKVRCCDAGGLDCTCNRGEWAFIVEKKVTE